MIQVAIVEDHPVFRKGLVQAIAAGARGYLSKQAEEAEIVGAIRAVAEGRTYVSATLAAYLLQAPIHISEREREILELVAGGETDQDIAELLQVSVRTVHSHLDRIRNKTGSPPRGGPFPPPPPPRVVAP